jgi:hypothetical protein
MFKKAIRVVMAGIVAFLCITTYTAHYPASPYVIVQAGLPRVEVDWESEKWADTFEIKHEYPITFAIGALINPAYTGDWLFSVEAGGKVFIKAKKEEEAWHQYYKEPIGLILGKLTLPVSENHDWFGGVGFGFTSIDSKRCISFVSELGHNWHINNGFYIRLTGRYLKPIAGSAAHNKPNTFTLNGGIQYNLL